MANEELRRKEHNAFREKVVYHDFTHQMLKAEGPDAGAFMDKMFVNDISGKAVGQGVYTSELNEDGEMIDDLIVFRMEEDMSRRKSRYSKRWRKSWTRHQLYVRLHSWQEYWLCFN